MARFLESMGETLVSRPLSLSLILSLSVGARIAPAGETYVYVSMAPEQSICILRMNDGTGALTEVERLKVDGAPGSLAVDPQRKFLFASLRSTSKLAGYTLDRATGKLAPHSETSLTPGANAAFVTTDRQGKYLLSASYAGGNVVVHSLSNDGRISEQPLQVIETARTAHCVAIDDRNQSVFVPHVAPNSVYQFQLNHETGRLTDAGQAPGGAEGAGPRHLAFHPTFRYAFTSDESGSSVTLYSVDPVSGLKPLQTRSTLPDGFAEQNSTAEVKVHPSGRFVWVSNRGHDSLAGFRFDIESAMLTSLGQTPTEKTPRSFDIEPSGRFLFSAGEGTGNLAAFRIDPESGELTRIATYELGKSLPWVATVRIE